LKLIDGVEKLEEPKEGMKFYSLDELASHYRTYAKQQGFGVVQKNKKKMQAGIHITSPYHVLAKAIENLAQVSLFKQVERSVRPI
jgi:cell fate (sporulation/competence/biofilm development) regulator YmcA (YheA/YmcA/DUF963 family)